MTLFEEYCRRQRWRFGDQFVPPTGDDLIRAYNLGPEHRVWILVDDVWKRGTVGLSMGWAPTFILLHNKRSRGGYSIDESNTISYERVKPTLTRSRAVLSPSQEATP